MSTLCPYSIIKGDDGLSVKVEWDVHYLTDEQIGMVRKYVAEIEAENAELRRHVKMPDEPLEIDEKDFYARAFIKWAIEEQPEVKRLEAENAKLRELLDYMTPIAWHAASERERDRMYELGVEP